jgi:hypothetical protein
MSGRSHQPGKCAWAFSAGHIPLTSTGSEPEFTSHDKIAVLNISDQDAEIEMTVYYINQQPLNGFKIKVKARRVRKFRINDLIDPLPVSLDTPYSLIFHSQVPVIVQFTRQTTESPSYTGFCTTPYSIS